VKLPLMRYRFLVSRRWSPQANPTARHQRTLRDHVIRVGAPRDMPVYFPAFAGTKLYCLVTPRSQVRRPTGYNWATAPPQSSGFKWNMCSYINMASRLTSLVNRVWQSGLVVHYHHPLFWQHLAYDAKGEQDAGHFLCSVKHYIMKTVN